MRRLPFGSRADSHLTRTQVKLDARGWKDVDKELGAALKRIEKVADDAGKRLAKAGGDAQDATIVMMLFGTADEAEAAASAKRNGSAKSKKRARARA